MSRRKVKVVTIGGGSSYTPELVEGFINRKDRIDISEWYFVDVEEGREKLEIVGAMAKRMVKAAGLDWEVKLTLNREEALKDADYVTTQFRVGLLDARIRDERIPAAYGSLGQETNAAGGIFKALRTIPVIKGIVDDMRKLCPDAWLINFTNPAGMVTEAVVKNLGWKKCIGLCNVPIGHISAANKLYGYDTFEQKLFFKFAGLNHFHWHRVWDTSGKEITNDLIDKLYHPDNKAAKDMENIHQIPFIYEQVKDLGMLPCGYHRYYYLSGDMLDHMIEDYNKNETRAETVKKTEAELFELYKDPALDHKPEQLTKRGGTHYSDAACECICSIENDERTMMVVSTENNGTIDDLPYDAAVEITSFITKHGAEPLNWGKFPPAERGMLQVMKSMEELTIEAALTGNYNKAVQAFSNNPLISTGKNSIDMLNEMLVANKKYLPQFKEKIAELEKAGVKYTHK
ncbi:MAG: 6-phospho-beta-glucosidase [Erysipelotrichaceae bacterium]